MERKNVDELHENSLFKQFTGSIQSQKLGWIQHGFWFVDGCEEIGERCCVVSDLWECRGGLWRGWNFVEVKFRDSIASSPSNDDIAIGADDRVRWTAFYFLKIKESSNVQNKRKHFLTVINLSVIFLTTKGSPKASLLCPSPSCASLLSPIVMTYPPAIVKAEWFEETLKSTTCFFKLVIFFWKVQKH